MLKIRKIGGDNTIFEFIKEMCMEKGITITELERKLGFGNATIHNWKTKSPTIEKLKKVADFFDVSLDDLVGIRVKVSDEAMNIASEYDSFTDQQKNLLLCYISLIKTGQVN